MKSKIEEIRSRLPAGCHILAVSKFHSVESIHSLFDEGQRDFAENYVQEAREKQARLRELSIRWHFIGRLQKNKVKDVVGHFELIHSVDSYELAQVIDQKAALKGLRQKVLLQLNLALEETKGGFSERRLSLDLSSLLALKNIEIRGLMTMPPLFDEAEKTRPYFRRLRELRDELQQKSSTVTELSMGTSDDFHIAAQEGATWVRLGTVLFGERPTR